MISDLERLLQFWLLRLVVPVVVMVAPLQCINVISLIDIWYLLSYLYQYKAYMMVLYIVIVTIVVACIVDSHGYKSILSSKKTLSSSYISSFPSSISLLLSPVPSQSTSLLSPRVQRIKDISLQREIIKDITAAEFAVQVEIKVKENEVKIDYEKLIGRLNRDLQLLSKRQNKSSDDSDMMIQRIKATRAELYKKLSDINDNNNDYNADDDESYIVSSNDIIKQSRGNSIISNNLISDSEAETIKEKITETIRVIVREDGTVDWDGAKSTGRDVAKFGKELWERLNGKEEEEGMPSLSDLLGQAQVKEPVTEEISRLKLIVDEASLNLRDAEKKRDDLKQNLRQARREGLTIAQADVETLNKLDIEVKELTKCLTLFTVDLDMERICVYIQQELESSLEPNEQRTFVAEIALIDKQLSSIVTAISTAAEKSKTYKTSIPNSARASMSSGNPISLSIAAINDEALDLIELIDEDELNLITSAVNDLKSRLGLDTEMAPAMDWGSLGAVVSATLNKIKDGLNFFGIGTNILFTDLQYAWFLLLRAVTGYTLKAREVNAVRRTGKDVLTLIPFTIILIIPLSPIGHVLVFSFIQRYFPDFFPSCYTEKRQNLKRLYSEIERKSDDELLGPDNQLSDQIATISRKTQESEIFKWLSIKIKDFTDKNE